MGLGARARWARIGPAQLALLGATTAIGPLTIDLYLPALPAMADRFGVGASQLQLSLTAAVVGMALGQLAVGPVSDRYGRRGPLLVGLSGYVLVTLALAFAPSLPALVAGRFLQGVLAAAAIVVTRAVLRDHVSGADLGTALAGLVLVMGAGPILAPTLGSLLLSVTGWQGIFVALAALAGVMVALLAWLLPESLPAAARRRPSVRALLAGYGSLLSDRTFVAPALTSAFSFAALFAYIAAGTFLLQGRYGLSQIEYALVFAVTASCVIGGSQLGSRLIRRIGSLQLLRVVPGIGAGAAVGIVAVTMLDVAGLPVLVGLLMVVSLASGITLPVGATVALTGQPAYRAGTASGLIGVLQFFIGGLAAPVVGLLGTSSPIGMAAVMTVAFLLAAVMGRLSRESVAA